MVLQAPLVRFKITGTICTESSSSLFAIVVRFENTYRNQVSFQAPLVRLGLTSFLSFQVSPVLLFDIAYLRAEFYFFEIHFLSSSLVESSFLILTRSPVKLNWFASNSFLFFQAPLLRYLFQSVLFNFIY